MYFNTSIYNALPLSVGLSYCILKSVVGFVILPTELRLQLL